MRPAKRRALQSRRDGTWPAKPPAQSTAKSFLAVHDMWRCSDVVAEIMSYVSEATTLVNLTCLASPVLTPLFIRALQYIAVHLPISSSDDVAPVAWFVRTILSRCHPLQIKYLIMWDAGCAFDAVTKLLHPCTIGITLLRFIDGTTTGQLSNPTQLRRRARPFHWPNLQFLHIPVGRSLTTLRCIDAPCLRELIVTIVGIKARKTIDARDIPLLYNLESICLNMVHGFVVKVLIRASPSWKHMILSVLTRVCEDDKLCSNLTSFGVIDWSYHAPHAIKQYPVKGVLPSVSTFYLTNPPMADMDRISREWMSRCMPNLKTIVYDSEPDDRLEFVNMLKRNIPSLKHVLHMDEETGLLKIDSKV